MNRRTLFTLLLCLAGVLGAVVYYARELWLLVVALAVEQTLYLGLYAVPAVLLGGGILRLLGGRAESRALGIATALALGLGALGYAELLLGMLGLLNGPVLWGLLGVSALAGLPLLRQKRQPGLPRLEGEPIALPGLWVAVALYLGVAIVAASLLPGILWKPDDPHPYDALIYHLQVPREWFEIGRIVPLEHNVYSYFPFNVEIHYLAMMHMRGSPWAAMYQAQYFGILLSGAAAAALWGALRPVSGPGAALAAAAFLLTPWVAMLSSVAYVESGQMFFVAVSLAWLIRRPVTARSCTIAGLVSGLSAGVKLTSLAMFTLPAALFLAVASKDQRRAWLTRPLLFVLCTLLTLSPWLLRNQSWAGNPVFPVAMSQLGHAHFTPDQVVRFEKAHQPRDDQQGLQARLAATRDQIGLDWRCGLVLLPLAAAGFALAIGRREAWLCLAVVLGTLVVWLLATHLQGRFFTIALPALAVLIGLLPPRAAPWIALTLCLAALANLTSFTLPDRATTLTGLNAYLAPAAEGGRQGLFALSDPSPLVPEEVGRALEAGRTVLFVGNAQMFLQTGPMRQIRYRSVFDVDAPAGRSLIDAWYAPPPATAPADIVPVMSVSELERLHQTYYAIPPFDPRDTQRFPRAVVMP